MKSISFLSKALKALTITGLCLLFTFNASAQTTAAVPSGYLTMAYIKVAPNKIAEYLKMEKAYKKLHAAGKKAGMRGDWTLYEVITPWGESGEYNFIAHDRYETAEQYAGSVEGTRLPNWESLLTAEEMSLVKRTDEIRTLVKTEVWSLTESIMPDGWDKKGKIAVFNYIANGAGKTRADHVKIEKDIWMPVHSQRIKDGKMTAWWLMTLEAPFGSSMPYNSVAVDLYPDMKSYLANWFDEYFKKVHPTKNVDDLMKQTRENSNLFKGEVRMVVDRLSW